MTDSGDGGGGISVTTTREQLQLELEAALLEIRTLKALNKAAKNKASLLEREMKRMTNPQVAGTAMKNIIDMERVAVVPFRTNRLALEAFYKNVNPKKIRDIDGLLRKFSVQSLNIAFRKRYGVNMAPLLCLGKRQSQPTQTGTNSHHEAKTAARKGRAIESDETAAITPGEGRAVAGKKERRDSILEILGPMSLPPDPPSPKQNPSPPPPPTQGTQPQPVEREVTIALSQRLESVTEANFKLKENVNYLEQTVALLNRDLDLKKSVIRNVIGKIETGALPSSSVVSRKGDRSYSLGAGFGKEVASPPSQGGGGDESSYDSSSRGGIGIIPAGKQGGKNSKPEEEVKHRTNRNESSSSNRESSIEKTLDKFVTIIKNKQWDKSSILQRLATSSNSAPRHQDTVDRSTITRRKSTTTVTSSSSTSRRRRLSFPSSISLTSPPSSSSSSSSRSPLSIPFFVGGGREKHNLHAKDTSEIVEKMEAVVMEAVTENCAFREALQKVAEEVDRMSFRFNILEEENNEFRSKLGLPQRPKTTGFIENLEEKIDATSKDNMDMTKKKKKRKKKKKKSSVSSDNSASHSTLHTSNGEGKNYMSFNPRAPVASTSFQPQGDAEASNEREREIGEQKGKRSDGDENLDEELDKLVASASSERRRRRHSSIPNLNNKEVMANVKRECDDDVDDGIADNIGKVVPLPVVPPLIAPPEEVHCHDKEDNDVGKSPSSQQNTASQNKTKKERRKQKRKKKIATKKMIATSDITPESENKQKQMKTSVGAETKDANQVLPNEEKQLQQGGVEKNDEDNNVESPRTGRDKSSFEEPIAVVTSEKLSGEDNDSSVTQLEKKNIS